MRTLQPAFFSTDELDYDYQTDFTITSSFYAVIANRRRASGIGAIVNSDQLSLTTA